MESDVITLQDIFIARAAGRGAQPRRPRERRPPARPLECTGLKPDFLEKMAANGVILPPSFFGGQNGYGTNYSAASFGGFE